MGDKLIMSQKELLRKKILEQVLNNHLSHADAAKKLSVCSKTVSRSLKRYKAKGDAGLIHKSRGKPSSRAKGADFKEKVLELYMDKYEGFGPTFCSEKLEEDDGIIINPETLRLWLKEAGFWLKRRKRKLHRSRRARRPKFGELLQLDGSIHSWFGDENKKQCLMNLVDDATGKTLALMDYGETTRSALALLKWWIQDAGIPMVIYVDLKSVYVSPKSLKEKEEEKEDLVEHEWLTHFSKACKKLGIEVIKAYSAQAKGRVERNHAVYQDRFVKELKLKNIEDIEEANKLLSGGFVNKLNSKFAKPAQDEANAHAPLSSTDDLEQILCFEHERTVANDWVVRFNNKHYQIEEESKSLVKPRQKITVRLHLDESISLWHNKERLKIKELSEKPIRIKEPKEQLTTAQLSAIARANKHNSPWSSYNPDWLKPKPQQVNL